MTTPVPPRDSTAPLPPLTPGLLDSEDALKRVFFAQHASLTAEAKAHLGDASATLGSKVVEGAFVRAWDARATLQTPEQLNKFLIDDVHHAAARALSRRVAAHRFAGHTASGHQHEVHNATAEESWEHIHHALHGEEHKPGTLAAVAAASRHGAADHIGGLAKTGNVWIAMGAGLLVIALGVGGVLVMNRLGEKTKLAKAVTSTEVRPVTTPSGRTGNVSLNDGSTAHLAPETVLTIPNEFGVDLRAVRVEGAAGFDVAPGLPKELHVFAGGADIVAKGTKFTVSAYPGDSTVTIVVGEGSVEVHRGEEVFPVAAGAGAVVREGAPLRAASEVERDVAAGWRTGMLALSDKPLRDALALMKRWYGYEIRVPDMALLERKVTMKVSADSAMQAIAAVEKSTGLKFGYIGPNMAFQDPAAKKAKP
jgi:transmembrane sensor